MSDIQPTEQEHHEEQTALELALRNGLAWLSANVTTVIYGLAAVLAIAAVVVFLQRKPEGNTEASKLLLVASTPEQYQDIADSTPTSPLGMWSRLRQGDSHLNNAVANMFTDREKGVEDLAAAKEAYENLGSQSGLPNDLRERVLIGMARIAECECDGTESTVEAAKSAWQELLGAFPESLVKDHAEERIARLEKSKTAEFYKWFAALEPKPASAGLGGNVPEIPDGLLPNDFPGAAPSEEPTTEEATTEEATDTKPEETPEADAKQDEAPGDSPEKTEQPDKPAAPERKADAVKPEEPANPDAADKKETPAATEEAAETQEAKPAEETAEAAKATEAAEEKPEAAKADGDN